MMRVISSPSSSTTGFATFIFAISCSPLAASRRQPRYKKAPHDKGRAASRQAGADGGPSMQPRVIYSAQRA
jgi:hypothetical protein